MAKRIVDEEMRFNIVVNGNEAQKELFDLERSTRKLTEQNKAYREEQAKLVKQGKKNSEEYKRLSAAIKENNATISSNKAQMKTLQDQIGITGLSMAQLRKKASQLRLALNNMVPGSAEYKRYQADLQQVNARLDELRAKSKSTKTSLGSIADGFNRFAALGASVIAAGTGIVLTLQKMIDYNGQLADAQSNVRKTTGLTAQEVDELTKSFGALKTRTARIELLGLAEEAGRLGITGTKNIKDFVEVANQMKVALGDDLGDEQIREVGKMVKIYKVGERTGRDFKNSLLSMGSAINEVSASGANQAGFLVDFVKRTAGISDVANIAAEDMIGLAAAFDEAGQSQEISATAINKFFGSAAENVADFAKVAGVSIEEYSRLLREDANEALILFLKGLKQGNPSLEEMAMRLDGIELGGTRGAQAITALSANIENLEEKQRIANKSLLEATSLTDEYNLKNNNLAGTLDKVKKKMLGAFSSDAVTATLTGLVGLFGRLIGAIDDVNEAFAEETELLGRNSRANRKLAEESALLLAEYQSLTKDGVEPTIEEKERLDIITLQLKDRLGESVMSIDAETGAYILNTEAVKKQIEMKVLLADEEAATLVSRRYRTKETIKTKEEELQLAQKEFDLRQKIFNDKNAADIAAINSARDLNAMEKQAMLERLDGYKELDRARLKTGKINQELYEQNKRLTELNSELSETNISQAQADAYFEENPTAPPPKTPGGSPTPTPTKTKGDPVKEARKRAEELLQLMREAEDRKLDIMEDGFNKQMLLEDFNHYRKIEDLQNKLVSQEQIAKTKDANLKASYIANNEAVNSQIESENQLHQIRKATILEKGYADDIKISQQAYEREKVIRETAFLEELNSIKTLSEAKDKLKETLSVKELAQLKTLDDAKKVLQDQFNAKELEEQKKHLDKLVAQLMEFMESGQFEGFDMSLLSPEQQIEFQAQVDALKLKIQELIAEKNKLSGKPAEGEGEIDLGVAGEMDVLGFSADQWLQTFSNLETLGDKIGAASMAVQGFMNAWSMYHEMVSANERKELNNFIKSNDKKKERLKSRLDQGYINQRQYDDAIKALDAEADKRKADMEYKQAKRAWQMQLTQAIANTAMAVLNGLQSTPFLPVGIAMGALAGVLGGIQIATIAKNKPVKGFESGYYNVTREQDGKNFNAQFGGESRSGLVDKPTVFLAGEGGKNFPEMIIDGNSYKQMSPMVKEALNYEIARIKGFQNGYYQNQTQQPEFKATNNTSTTDIMLVEALNRNSEILEKLEANGVTAFMDKEMRNIKKLRDEFQRLEKIENKRKTN